MASKTVVELVDDLDGSAATQTVHFAVDGVRYEIDLNDEHAEQLREALQRWTTHGRRVGGRRRRSAPAPEDQLARMRHIASGPRTRSASRSQHAAS